MTCHVTVRVNFCLGSKVQFLCVITQSTGLVFLPGLPIGKKLGSNVTFMYIKNSVQSCRTMHRVYFCIKFYQTCTLSPTKHKTKERDFFDSEKSVYRIASGSELSFPAQTGQKSPPPVLTASPLQDPPDSFQ